MSPHPFRLLISSLENTADIAYDSARAAFALQELESCSIYFDLDHPGIPPPASCYEVEFVWSFPPEVCLTALTIQGFGLTLPVHCSCVMIRAIIPSLSNPTAPSSTSSSNPATGPFSHTTPAPTSRAGVWTKLCMPR